MQGVRTTRGCSSCQRRKKGCDLQKPQCGRCQRLGVTCTYQPRTWTFVDERVSPAARASRAGRTARATQSPAPLNVASGTFARTDHDMQTEAAFWAICLPREDASLDGSIGGVRNGEWLLTARALAQVDECLRLAIQACSYSGVGWMHNDKGLAGNGLMLYAQALRQTNEALADPLRAQKDSLLACCRVLSLFEMFRHDSSLPGTGGSPAFDWERHVEGTFRMVELRGYDKHCSGHGLALYDAVRMPAVIQALGRRKPNSFTKLAWDLPRQTSLRDDLFNIACRIPELLQAIDVFVACFDKEAGETENKSQLVQQSNRLIEQCTLWGARLCDWEASAIAHCADTDRGEPLDDSVEGASELSLISHCKLHGYAFFFICCQYWAVCVVLYSSARLLLNKAGHLADPDHPTADLAPLPSWIDPEQHAVNIAKCTPHFFRPEAGLWAAQSAVFPIMTAFFYFARTGRGGSELSVQMKQAFENSQAGSVVSTFLQSVLDRQ